MLKEVFLWLLGATDYMTSLAYQYQIAFVLTVALVGLIIMGCVHVHQAARRSFRLWRGKHMTKGERIQYLKMRIADHLTNALEDDVFTGKITRWEAQREYRKLGMYLKNMELVPRLLHPNKVKKELQSHPSMVVSTEVNIPGPKPGEDMNVIPFPDYKTTPAPPVPERKKLGAAYSARKAASA